MRKNILYSIGLLCAISSTVAAQKNAQESEEQRRIKAEHAQIGITDDVKSNYKRTTNPDAQWFPDAGFGMFIHWSISSVNEVDISWAMITGAKLSVRNPKPTDEEMRKYMEDGDYLAFMDCKKTNSCLTPNQYWDLAKKFNPSSFDPDIWARQAKEAGMTYVVLTARHHDGFALWPSKYGDFNTKNYMGGRDLVKEYIAACRKYGLKVGLYYSGPDWHFDKDFHNFMYWRLKKDFPFLPELDADLHPRTTQKTEAEKQQHYENVAAYLTGQIEELLTNYGKIDMLWFDGTPDIPKDNSARNQLITVERIHQLQPGIVLSPRFYGYGDYESTEGDGALPTTVQSNWSELCSNIETLGWGYCNSPVKTSAFELNQLAVCRANNTNFLLNFGPDKNGVFCKDMADRLHDFAAWMKVNGSAIKGTHALDPKEQASVPAVANEKHRYLFVMPKTKNDTIVAALPLPAETITFKTSHPIKKIQLLGQKVDVKYEVNDGQVTIHVPSEVRTINGDVLDVVLK
ncbi:alpha-L-fucosidase [Pinibacter aurantiacus]|uniref:Alpha-L-fucosidase n=1 Tax=Pinibacter aurantiacus TaxID=2851599 RepID=A0A9E2S8E1_9BACT|nr:alpha-L-fucosidase [Pinibacter aurantiacus]MBV4358191.1 alpha-L-fucosidase [Pinibacter aurantiacus]